MQRQQSSEYGLNFSAEPEAEELAIFQPNSDFDEVLSFHPAHSVHVKSTIDLSPVPAQESVTIQDESAEAQDLKPYTELVVNQDSTPAESKPMSFVGCDDTFSQTL
jgi:hypothetical protein